LRSLLLLLALAFPGAVFALEKCVGADGKVTYSDRGCAAGVKRSSVGGDASLTDATMEYYDVASPGGHTAYTSWNLSYRYTNRSVPGGCKVDTVTTRLDLKVRMPRWTPAAGTSADLDARWGRYISALQVHEAGHVQTGRDFDSNFKRAAMGLSAADCGALDSALRAQFNSFLKQANARDKDYDAQTQHGATQGAYFK
jgi:hypothetical protein